MKARHLIILLITIVYMIPSGAQNRKDFKPMCDSLTVLLQEKTSVKTKLSMESVVKRGSELDFHFSQELSDYNWDDSLVSWFVSEIAELMPESYASSRVGEVYAKKVNVKTLVTPGLGNNGKPSEYKYRYEDPRDKVRPLVSRNGARTYGTGLSGRHIALWQSHGYYYETKEQRWEWQRAQNHRTVEDMYTQSYVLPFLIPMLENAGAYVMTPRERDIQRHEVIIDNDPAFTGERDKLTRQRGRYSERGNWSDAGIGFADKKREYTLNDNPFRMGTSRKTAVASEEVGQRAEAKWSFRVPADGDYAVYVSYTTLSNSSEDASYTVFHANGKTGFKVNQKMGGGTWIYLGTFPFIHDSEASVVLDNISEGEGGVVTADAVKIGGGMGKIARGEVGQALSTYKTSGVPCYMEGALYWEQFAGIDTTVTRNWEGDYTQDYASRGAWVTHMSGGSHVNPKTENGKGIPFDLSLGFHSDAGITPNDSTIGTLAIYTLLADGKDVLPNGRSRQLGRHLAGLVQDQICNDLRIDFDPQWSRRMLWNRNYSESRTTSVPAMLLEILSHQNFADMKYGLDPSFRFTVSRAVYKGILKFLSDEYGIRYTVQPLPVNSMAVRFTSDTEVELSWKATVDEKEKTADAKSFILYTRLDDGLFDQGIRLEDCQYRNGVYSTSIGIDKDVMYSFRIVAENDGGLSFPSETVSIGRSSRAKGSVLVVNNFDRVSAPTWFDTPEYAGFDGRLDSGVPYMYDISYIGENYEFRRKVEWTDDDSAGFGATHSEHAGTIVPGNTFDFIRIHGKAIMEAGYSFYSSSREAFMNGNGAEGKDPIDILCGKQVTTKIGSGALDNRYQVFPVRMQEAISASTQAGHGIIISGAHIATDVWDSIYPVEIDGKYSETTRDFVKKTLGYTWLTGHGSHTGAAAPSANKSLPFKGLDPFEFYKDMNGTMYSVENPDGIRPADTHGSIIMKYTGNNVPAAVSYEAKTHRAVSFGFPLESIKDEEALNRIFRDILKYLN